MSEQYRDAQEIINNMARVKMVMNAHKGQIEECATDLIVSCLKEETAELEEALQKGNLMHVIEEAADVQNFLLAIVQQALTQYRSRKNIE